MKRTKKTTAALAPLPAVDTTVGSIQVLKVWDDGWRTAVALIGRKRCNLVGFGTPIRVRSVSVEEVAKMQPVLKAGKPYPLADAAARILEAGTHHGITQGAKDLLARVTNTQPITADEADATPVDTSTGTGTKGTAAPGVLAGILAELGLVGTKARRQLRKAGLHAPYTDAAAIRAVLTKE